MARSDHAVGSAGRPGPRVARRQASRLPFAPTKNAKLQRSDHHERRPKQSAIQIRFVKRAEEETEKSRASRPKSGGSAKGEPYTAILALTRDPLARDLLMELAMERGYGLCGAVSGTQAIRVLSSEPPALVIVDLDIPD